MTVKTEEVFVGTSVEAGFEGTTFNITGALATTAATTGSAITITGGVGNTTAAGGAVALIGGAGGATGNGGAANITGGHAIGGTGVGGSVFAIAGNSQTSSQGGWVDLLGGIGGLTGIGGEVRLRGGPGGATSGAGGPVTLTGGVPIDGPGGSITITGGAAAGTDQAGSDVTIAAGTRTGTGAQGRVLFTSGETSYPLTAAGAGPALTTTAQTIIEAINEAAALAGGGAALAATLLIGNTTGGTDIVISSGDEIRGVDAATGLALALRGGNSSGAFAGGAVTITGGTPTAGAGGSVSLIAAAGVGTDQAGGNVAITAGAKTGTGAQGIVTFTSGERAYGLTAAGAGPALTTTAQTIIESINEIDAAIAGQNELSEILTNGNTTGGTNIVVSSGDEVTGVDAATGLALALRGGNSSGAFAGGAVTLTGGAPTAGAGGSVTIAGAAGVGTNQAGGNVAISAGARTGTGAQGIITFTSGETSYPLTAAGAGPALTTTAQTIIEAINEVDGATPSGVLLADGSAPLTANWDAGAFEIRAQTFESDVTTGTAPFVVASTTLVTNLNADQLDSQEGSYYLDLANATGTLAIADGGTGAITDAAARVALGVEIGVDVQAQDAELAALAGLTSAADSLPYFTGLGTASLTTLTTFGRSLIDDADASAGRSTLGLGTIATQSAASVSITGGSITGITDLAIADGGTGASTATLARAALGVEIGVDVQAYDADLSTVAGLGTALQILRTNSGATAVEWVDHTAASSEFGDDVFRVLGSVDPSKEVAFEVDGLTTTTTRTLTVQDASGTIALVADLVLRDGSQALSANWDAGAFEIRAATFESDITTGTAPLVIASTTLVSNLNADLLDSQEGSYYLALANATGTLAIADGGTGQATAGAAFDALSPLTTLGDSLYGGASGTGTRLAGNITAVKQFLSQTGTGAVSAAPAWATLAFSDVTGTLGIGAGGTGATSATDARTNLGLVIGTNVQAYDAELAAIAGLTSVADRLPYFTGSGTASLATFTAFGRSLVDDADASAGRTTLGLGTIATQAANSVSITGGSISGITDLAIADGGTGSSTDATARVALGVEIGVDVQAFDADLDTVAGLGTALQILRTNAGVTAVEWVDHTAASSEFGDDVFRILGSVDPSKEVAFEVDGLTTTTTRTLTVQDANGTIALVADLVLRDGSQALSANWDAGSFEIRAATFESDVTTGTAPLVIASTTLVSNLNADLLDSQEGSYYLDLANATGTLTIADGGTGQTTAGAAFNALSPLTALGDVVYGAASGSGTRLAGNITAVKQFLSQTGTGAVSAAPAWATLSFSDVTGTLGIADGGTGATSAVDARTNLGLVIGTNVQAQDAELQAIAGLTSAADRLPYFTGLGAASLATFTVFGRSLVDDADASAGRSTLGLGTIATQSAASVSITGGSVTGITDLTVADGGTGASNVTDARTNLGLTIGTNVQAWDADLDTVAAIGTSLQQIRVNVGGTALEYFTQSGAGNLLADGSTPLTANWDAGAFEIRAQTFESDVTTGTAPLVVASTTLVTNLNADLLDSQSGAYYLAAANITGTIDLTSQVTGALPIANGGTGAITAPLARTALGLEIGTDVQTQDAELEAIAGLTSAADRLPYFTGLGTASLATFTAFGRSLVDDADASAGRTTLGLVIGTNVQAQDAELQAIAGLTSAADRVPYFTGSGTAALGVLTAFGRSLVDDADASAGRTTLGLGTIATQSAASVSITGGSITGITDLTIADGGTGASTASAAFDALSPLTTLGDVLYGGASGTGTRLVGNITAVKQFLSQTGTGAVSAAPAWATLAFSDVTGTLGIGAGGTGATSAGDARTNLGLVIGTDVQTQDAELEAIAGLTSAADRLPYFTGSGTASLAVFTTFGRSLVDDVDASAGRATLGLGTIATQSAASVAITGGSVTGITDITVADGGTGASTAGDARTNLGLAIGSNVQAWDADLDTIATIGTTLQQIRVNVGGTALEYFTPAAATADTLAATLAVGNVTGGTDLVVSSGDDVRGVDNGAGNGLPLSLRGGSGTGSGGNVFMTGGPSSSSGGAGSVTISGGAPTSGGGGAVTLQGAAGVGTNQLGGTVTLQSGAGTGTSQSATVNIFAAAAGGTGNGGEINIVAGNSGLISGSVSITGGTGTGAGRGGDLELRAGAGGPTGLGGDTYLRSGNGGATSGDSGDILINAGTAAGSGDDGRVIFTSGATTYGLTASGVAGPALTTTATTIIEAINEVDAAITATNELSEVLANGNTTGGTDLVVSSGDDITGLTKLDINSTSGAVSTVQHAEALLSGLTGATATAASLIPAGALILGVSVRVNTLITGATSFDIGDGSDVSRWGATIAVAATTTSDPTDFTENTVSWQGAAAGDVVLTANGSNFTAGAVRVVVTYISLSAPTS